MKLHHSALIALCAAVMISVQAEEYDQIYTILCEEEASLECDYYNYIECCEYSDCDLDGTPKCTEEYCCIEKPEADKFYCVAKNYDCEYEDKERECCEEEGCDGDKPVCSEDYCCKEKDEDNKYDLTCASVKDVDPRKRCNNGKDVIEDKECCRYTDRCSEGHEQSKCLHSFCCERDDRDDKTCEDIYDCDYKDKDMDCGDDDEDCTLEACCKDTDPDGKYDVFCDEEILEESDPNTDECRRDDEELIEERACCRYSNRCSKNWTQKKCLYSNCCGKDGDDDDKSESSIISCKAYYKSGAKCDGKKQNDDERCKDRDSSSMACSEVCCKKDDDESESSFITCEKYYDNGAKCDGEKQNDDERCKDRDSSSMACSKVCCKKDEGDDDKECPPITADICQCGREKDENGCETECADCDDDDTDNDKKCEDMVPCDNYREDECCRFTDECSDGYEQSKCTEGFCCEP